MTNKIFVLVIGNICTGKSTFLSSLNIKVKRKTIKNDDYQMDNSWRVFNNDVLRAIDMFDEIIIEGIYVSRRSRKFIAEFIAHYPEMKFLCFDFGPGNDESLNRCLIHKSYGHDKIKMNHHRNRKEYERPTEKEGFFKVFKCFQY